MARKVYEPTPEEIRAGCEIERAKLTEAQLDARIVDSRLRRNPVTVRIVAITPRIARRGI